jgi:hypothetical protein
VSGQRGDAQAEEPELRELAARPYNIGIVLSEELAIPRRPSWLSMKSPSTLFNKRAQAFSASLLPSRATGQ